MYMVARKNVVRSIAAEDISLVAEHRDCVIGTRQRASGGQFDPM